MKDSLKFILLMIGIFTAFFIMGREIIETRAKLKMTRDQVSLQKKEKIWLHDELSATRGELAKTGKDLRVSQGKLAFVNQKIILLKGSNNTLIRAKQGLEYKISRLQEEKRIMDAKLHSLSELKKAIRDIKAQMRSERIRQRQEADKWETALGNHGFLTKDGVHYYKPKVNVEVRPANMSLNKK